REIEEIAVLEKRPVGGVIAEFTGLEQFQGLYDGQDLRQRAGVPPLVDSPHQPLRPAHWLVENGIEEMQRTTALEAEMKLCEDAAQQIVVEMMGCTREQDLVEELHGKWALSYVRGKEVHRGLVVESSLGGLDGNGVKIDTVVFEIAERIAEVAAGTSEVKQPARRTKLGAIELALEFRRTKVLLDEGPEPRH